MREDLRFPLSKPGQLSHIRRRRSTKGVAAYLLGATDVAIGTGPRRMLMPVAVLNQRKLAE